MSVGVAGTTDAHKQHFQIYKHPVNWAVHSVTWHPEFVERTNVTSNLSFRVVKFSSMSKYRAFMKSDSDYSFLDSGKTDGSSPGIFSYLSSGTSTGKFGITGIAKASISVAKNIDNVPKTATFTGNLNINSNEFVMLVYYYSGNVSSFPEFGVTLHGYQRP